MAALPMVLMAASTAVSAIGAVRQGQAAQASANFEAQQAEENAKQIRQQTGAQEDEQRTEARKIIGTQMAAQAGSGVQLNGSAADLLKQSLFNAESDAQAIRYSGETKARGLENQAIASRFSGKNAKQQGYLSAAGSLLSGGSKMYGMK